ncbi:MAG: hypothetical protein ACOYW9_09765, partial [Deinococcota bacterium]
FAADRRGGHTGSHGQSPALVKSHSDPAMAGTQAGLVLAGNLGWRRYSSEGPSAPKGVAVGHTGFAGNLGWRRYSGVAFRYVRAKAHSLRLP